MSTSPTRNRRSLRGYIAALVVVPVLLSVASVSASPSPTVELVAVVSTGQGPQLRTFEVRPADQAAETSRIRSRPDVLAAGTAATRSLPTQTVSPTGLLPDGDWGYRRLGGSEISRVGSGRGVIVAVLDTGVDARHPELQGRVLPGKDFVDPAGDGRSDPNGHGTHVAGVIAATADQNAVTGVAPSVSVLPVRVLGPDGVGDDAWLALGIVWAVDNGAQVLNLSVGGAVPSTLLEDSISYALDRGALVVVSAGNDGAFGNQPSYPAAYPAAFAVGATDASDRRSLFSNTGDYLDVAAPGSWIRSTWPGGGYQLLSGTSMAAPFVSGAAAVLLEATGVTGRELAARLRSSAIDLGPAGQDPEFGAGLVNPLAHIGVIPPALADASPALPQLPTSPIPSLPQLPSLTPPSVPTLPVPVLPMPTLPVPSLPVPPALTPPAPPAVPVLTKPSLPGAPSPPTRPISAGSFKIEMTTKVVSGNGRLVLEVTLRGPSALVGRRTLEVAANGRRFTVRTDWKGRARTPVHTGRVSVLLPASTLHAAVRSDVTVR